MLLNKPTHTAARFISLRVGLWDYRYIPSSMLRYRSSCWKLTQQTTVQQITCRKKTVGSRLAYPVGSNGYSPRWKLKLNANNKKQTLIPTECYDGTISTLQHNKKASQGALESALHLYKDCKVPVYIDSKGWAIFPLVRIGVGSGRKIWGRLRSCCVQAQQFRAGELIGQWEQHERCCESLWSAGLASRKTRASL